MAPSIRTVTSFGTIETIPDASSTGGFHLPTNLRQVQKQIHRMEPESLPEEDANKHEVRYFLYQLLTVESYRIAKSYPQWVLETCAFWQGTGADLRYMTDREMKLICPLDSGHCTLEKKQKTTPYPLPECRAMIGETIGQVVKKLKAKEVEKARLEREWRETQLGNSVRQRAINGHFKNRLSTNMEDLYPRPRPVTCSSAMSLPVLPERVAFPNFHERQKNFSEHLATDHHNYISSSGASLYPHVTTSKGPISLPLSSGEGSYLSGNTKSTAQTSPPGSVEETSGKQNGASQSALSRGDSLARRLSSAMSSRSLHSSLSTMCARRMSNASSIAGIVEQKQHFTNIAGGEDYFTQDYPPSYDQGRHMLTPHAHYQTQEPPVSLTQENLQEVISRNRHQRLHKPPQIIYHANPVKQQTRYSLYSQDWDVINDYGELRSIDSISCVGHTSSYPQSTYSSPPATSDISPRPYTTSPPPGIPQPHYSGVQEMSNYMDKMFLMPRRPTSSMSQRSSVGNLRRTLHPNSMNYPRPDICGPRIPSPAPSTQPPRSLSSSIIQRSPFTRAPTLKRSIPLLPTFTGPNRSTATSAVDTFALERGAYTTFKAGVLAARSEVVNSEVDRMSGMVPSKLHREGMECVGPTVRLMDGIGRPYPTLVEQIWEREILDRRRQRGARGKGLDCEVLKNGMEFYRGS